jgi:hypothetical protein
MAHDTGRTTFPASMSKTQQITTGRFGRGDGTHVNNLGRYHNATEHKVVGNVSEKLQGWCKKRAKQRKAAKAARKARYHFHANKPLTHKIGE